MLFWHLKMINMIYIFFSAKWFNVLKETEKRDHWHIMKIKWKKISQRVLANLFSSASRRAVDQDTEILSMTSVGGLSAWQDEIQPGDHMVVTKCVPNTHKHNPHKIKHIFTDLLVKDLFFKMIQNAFPWFPNCKVWKSFTSQPMTCAEKM